MKGLATMKEKKDRHFPQTKQSRYVIEETNDGFVVSGRDRNTVRVSIDTDTCNISVTTTLTGVVVQGTIPMLAFRKLLSTITRYLVNGRGDGVKTISKNGKKLPSVVIGHMHKWNEENLAKYLNKKIHQQWERTYSMAGFDKVNLHRKYFSVVGPTSYEKNAIPTGWIMSHRNIYNDAMKYNAIHYIWSFMREDGTFYREDTNSQYYKWEQSISKGPFDPAKNPNLVKTIYSMSRSLPIDIIINMCNKTDFSRPITNRNEFLLYVLAYNSDRINKHIILNANAEEIKQTISCFRKAAQSINKILDYKSLKDGRKEAIYTIFNYYTDYKYKINGKLKDLVKAKLLYDFGISKLDKLEPQKKLDEIILSIEKSFNKKEKDFKFKFVDSKIYEAVTI